MSVCIYVYVRMYVSIYVCLCTCVCRYTCSSTCLCTYLLNCFVMYLFVCPCNQYLHSFLCCVVLSWCCVIAFFILCIGPFICSLICSLVGCSLLTNLFVHVCFVYFHWLLMSCDNSYIYKCTHVDLSVYEAMLTSGDLIQDRRGLESGDFKIVAG